MTTRCHATSSLAEVARTWVRAIRSPWLAAASAACTVVVLAQLVRLVCTPLEQLSVVISLFLLVGTPTLIATLPATTVWWRVSSLLVGLNIGPVLNSPVESVSVRAYIETLEAATDGGGRGLILVLVCTLISLPVLEAAGAWFRRHALAEEAGRRGQLM